MDFAKKKRTSLPRLIEDGDLVIIYERHDSLDHIYVKKGEILNNKFGVFHHDEIIGKAFGSRIKSKSNSGWIYILQPTPELWSSAVHTRTQIVNEVDASVITLLLDAHPGCRIVESGTGSGCMTLSLARAVAPSGHVFTFEYNSIRAQTAREEFQRLGVSDLITVSCNDVCGKYFSNAPIPQLEETNSVSNNGKTNGFIGLDDNSVDAIFLDLPEPWLALDSAHAILKPGKTLCCYSPCIEQVMQTLNKLRSLNFHSIRMIEVRQRPYDARKISLETLDLGLSPEETTENEKSFRDPQLQHYHPNKVQGSNNLEEDSIFDQPISKRQRIDAEIPDDKEDAREDDTNHQNESNESLNDKKTPQQAKLEKRIRNRPKTSVNGTYDLPCARSIFTMKGHTAFLTFAIKSSS